MTATTKRHPTLFRWSVQDGLGANGKLIARSYRSELEGVFSRGFTKWVADRNGLYVPQVSAQLPFTVLAGVECLLLEAAATNVALHNRDLTNAAWTKTNTSAAKTQTGIDGVANSASLLTATAGNGTCLQAVTLASSARLQSAFVKRVTGSGTVQMTTDNGATWTAITVTAAWTRVTIPTQTLANPTLGFRLVTSGDAIAIDFVQNETGSAETSPIATTTTAQTRLADTLYFPFTPVPQAMTCYVRGIERGSSLITSGRYLQISNAANAAPRLILLHGGGNLQMTHDPDGSSVSSTGGGIPALNDVTEIRGTLNADGSVVAGVSYNGAAETVAAASAADAIQSAWSGERLYLSGAGGSTNFGFTHIGVAAGVKTLAEMRALAEAA